LHILHNENSEESIKEFVNRESFAHQDDLNADTINSLNQLDDPLLLCFVDLEIWDQEGEDAKKMALH
jgi:hypothetical protein